MSQRYTHLTQEERYQIYAFKKAKYSLSAIAQSLNRHESTIRRELKRNTGLRGYRPQQAQRHYEQRLLNKPKAIVLDEAMKQVLRERLLQQWSPEQIQGRLKLEGKRSVCTATIYAFIERDKLAGGTLYKHRRHQRYKPRKVKDLRGHIIDRVCIEQRPAVVDLKTRLGDWEADTVIGKGHQGVLVTLTERRSRLTLIARTQTKQAKPVTQSIIRLLTPYQANVHTITFDNGKEFAQHKQVASALKTACYFAHPYSSWERGLNENHNGLIRQYLPKGQTFNNISDEKVLWIQDRLNNRPKKILGYKTPNEVYNQMAQAV